jgi:hypothetical protein
MPAVGKSRRKREGRMRTTYKLISAIFAVALLSTPAAAQKSGTYSGKWGVEGVGQTYEIEKGHVFFLGKFLAVFFNDVAGGFLDKTEWTCPGFNDIVNGVSAAADGYCIGTDKDGDKVFFHWQSKGTGLGAGRGTLQYAGGTGKFSGIQGNGAWHYNFIGNTTGAVTVLDSSEWRLP